LHAILKSYESHEIKIYLRLRFSPLARLSTIKCLFRRERVSLMILHTGQGLWERFLSEFVTKIWLMLQIGEWCACEPRRHVNPLPPIGNPLLIVGQRKFSPGLLKGGVGVAYIRLSQKPLFSVPLFSPGFHRWGCLSERGVCL